MNQKKIVIGADHAGFHYKSAIMRHLKSFGYEVIDKGTFSEQSADYPDFAHPTAEAIEKGEAERGILICGSGNGVAMTANKHKGIRAALCWTPEVAALARQHNDANIICLPARFVSLQDAVRMVDVFLQTPFEGGRHLNRVQKINC